MRRFQLQRHHCHHFRFVQMLLTPISLLDYAPILLWMTKKTNQIILQPSDMRTEDVDYQLPEFS
jgi:hypothetical protein